MFISTKYKFFTWYLRLTGSNGSEMTRSWSGIRSTLVKATLCYLILLTFTLWFHGEFSPPVSDQHSSNDLHVAYIICSSSYSWKLATVSIKSLVSMMLHFDYNPSLSHYWNNWQHSQRESHQRVIHVHVISDRSYDLRLLDEAVQQWPLNVRSQLKVSYYLKDNSYQPFRAYILPGRCQDMKLHIHQLLPRTLEAIIHVDTSLLFLADIRMLWQESAAIMERGKQVMAVGYDQFDEQRDAGDTDEGSQTRGIKGVNAGILFLNLTRLHSLPWDWTEDLREIARVEAGDGWYTQLPRANQQQLISLYVEKRSDLIHHINCGWAFRYDLCHKPRYCPASTNSIREVYAVHSDGDVDSPPAIWSEIRHLWTKFEMGENVNGSIFEPLHQLYLSTHKTRNCSAYQMDFRNSVLKAPQQ